MTAWIALFRGVNVGGHNLLPMKGLAQALEKAGCVDVATYVQSGNVVLKYPGTQRERLTQLIQATVLERFEFSPKVLLLTLAEVQQAAKANPYIDAETEPKSLHLYFLAKKPQTFDIDAFDKIRSESEHYALIDQVFYLHAPDGFGRSKLAAKAESLLGVSATARNWRTVTKLLELASS